MGRCCKEVEVAKVLDQNQRSDRGSSGQIRLALISLVRDQEKHQSQSRSTSQGGKPDKAQIQRSAT